MGGGHGTSKIVKINMSCLVSGVKMSGGTLNLSPVFKELCIDNFRIIVLNITFQFLKYTLICIKPVLNYLNEKKALCWRFSFEFCA